MKDIEFQNWIIPPLGKITTLKWDTCVPFMVFVRDPRRSVKKIKMLWKADNQINWIQHELNIEVEEVEKQFSFEIATDADRIEFKIQYCIDGSYINSSIDSGVVLNSSRIIKLDAIKFSHLFTQTDSSIKVTRLCDAIFQAESLAIPGTIARILGIPSKLEQYMIIQRHSGSWLSPTAGHGLQDFDWDYRGVLLCFQRTDTLHVVILALSGTADNCTTYLKATNCHKIQLVTENDSSSIASTGQKVLVGIGSDLYSVIFQVFAASKKLICGKNSLSISLNSNFSNLPGERWYDRLIYCTWNGLGNQLSHSQIVDALKQLHNGGIRIAGIIIDDGWQSTTINRELYDIEACKTRFPKGLKGLVKDIRVLFPYIDNIGVWSTISGYWNGILPGSLLDNIYKTVDCHLGDRIVRLIDNIDIGRFHDNYFSFLSDCGINCIKIDYQSTTDEISEPLVRGKLWKSYQESLWKYGFKYFQSRIIYCMAMVPNIMLYSLQGNGHESGKPHSVVLRNSDDFFPEIIDSHYWHLYTNFYNCIYTSNLEAVPDFDMFQTKIGKVIREDSILKKIPSLHAAARCISGGPIYFTDTPSIHNLDVLYSFAAKSPKGIDIVLIPDSIAKPEDPYYKFGSHTLMRICNKVDREKKGIKGKLLGIFNLSDSTLIEPINTKCYNEETLREFIWYSYKRQMVYTLHNHVKVELESGKWDIWTFTKLVSDFPIKFSVLGLLNNICGLCGMSSLEKKFEGDTLELNIFLKAFGILGIYVEMFSSLNVIACIGKAHKPAKNIDISNVEKRGKLVKIEIDEAFLEEEEAEQDISVSISINKVD